MSHQPTTKNHSPPTISIVLPVYNGQRYLPESIESILAQTYPHFELIIVDDCSTDKTPYIIAAFAGQDKRIKPIRHTENKQLPGALNTGFNAAQGAYFTWTSDDNLYRPKALETMLDFLQKNPAVDVVYADYTLMDSQGKETRYVEVAPPNAIVYKAVVGACFLYKRGVHEALGGYDETMFLAEDYDFWMRAALRFNLVPLHEDLYLYRMHEGSLTEQKRVRVMAQRETMLRKHLPLFTQAQPQDMAQAYVHLVTLAQLRNDAQVARTYWRKAFSYAPFLTIRRWLQMHLPEGLRERLEKIYLRMK